MFSLFKRKQNVETTFKDDITILEDSIKKMQTRLTRLEAEILDVATAQDIIRNKVLRKIQFKKPSEEEESKDEWGGIPAI